MKKKKRRKSEEREFGLCFRCEWRAQFLETGLRPRYECGMTMFDKHSCYMYRPVRPIIQKKENKKDRRPFPGPAMLQARGIGVGLMVGKLDSVVSGDGVTLYWRPKK